MGLSVFQTSALGTRLIQTACRTIRHVADATPCKVPALATCPGEGIIALVCKYYRSKDWANPARLLSSPTSLAHKRGNLLSSFRFYATQLSPAPSTDGVAASLVPHGGQRLVSRLHPPAWHVAPRQSTTISSSTSTFSSSYKVFHGHGGPPRRQLRTARWLQGAALPHSSAQPPMSNGGGSLKFTATYENASNSWPSSRGASRGFKAIGEAPSRGFKTIRGITAARTRASAKKIQESARRRARSAVRARTRLQEKQTGGSSSSSSSGLGARGRGGASERTTSRKSRAKPTQPWLLRPSGKAKIRAANVRAAAIGPIGRSRTAGEGRRRGAASAQVAETGGVEVDLWGKARGEGEAEREGEGEGEGEGGRLLRGRHERAAAAASASASSSAAGAGSDAEAEAEAEGKEAASLERSWDGEVGGKGGRMKRAFARGSFAMVEERSQAGEEVEEELEESAAREEEQQLVTAVLMGRPNVGKSALFNRLTKRREALVLNTPAGHVTRDHKEGVAQLADLRLRLIDTAGLDPASAPSSVLARTSVITVSVLRRCQLILFLVDARAGLQPMDHEVVRWLRKVAPGVAIVPVANKCEGMDGDPRGALTALLAEAYRLGLGEAVPLSAETGEGLTALYDALKPVVSQKQREMQQQEQQQQQEQEQQEQLKREQQLLWEEEGGEERELGKRGAGAGAGDRASQRKEEEAAAALLPLHLAIAGRPNVGKSTLLNALAGERRSLTGPEPGLTRDAVRVRLRHRGRPILLVDTAGWMQRAQLKQDAATALGVMDAQRNLMKANVIVLVLDAAQISEARHTFMRSELNLARWVLKEGRALLIAVNKMDALDGPRQADLRRRLLAAVPKEIATHLPQVSGVPVLFVSALEERGCEELMQEAAVLHDRWCTRLPTAHLNRWLRKVKARAPTEGGAGSKVRYLTQFKARPPTFIAFCTGSPKPMPEVELRYLASTLREDFSLAGVPVRVVQRHKTAD